LKSFKLVIWAIVFEMSFARTFAAIDIVWDYSYDSGNYFTDARKYVMEQVAYAFESRLGNESFGSLDPDDYSGSTMTPYLTFGNPTTGSSTDVNFGSTTSEGNVVGAANTVVIFLGAQAVGTGNYLGVARQGYGTGSYFPGDPWKDYWDNTRNSSTNWDSIGGAISVNSSFDFYADTDLTTHSDATTSGDFDFYSVMAHELGHIMGFSSLPNAWISSSSWTGGNATAEYSGNNVPMNGNPHFSSSLVEGNVNCACHPAMLASIPANTRRGFSELDFAVLEDMGYSISSSPNGTNIGGTYTDPSWGGSYYIPVSQSYSSWLAGDPVGGGGGASAAPEPAYIFTLLGGLVALLGGKKKLKNLRALFGVAK
jgi:hypothetical protein